MGMKSQIESKIEDIDLLLTSCSPFSAMHGIKNLSSDLGQKWAKELIDSEEYANYMSRLEKMIFDTEKTCKCNKTKK